MPNGAIQYLDRTKEFAEQTLRATISRTFKLAFSNSFYFILFNSFHIKFFYVNSLSSKTL